MAKHSNQGESGAIRRRRFILRRLDQDGEFTYEDLNKQALLPPEQGGDFPVSHQSVRDDVEYLGQLLGMKIESVKVDGRLTYLTVDQPRATDSARAARSSHNAEAKLAMAYVAATLVVGSRVPNSEDYTVGSPTSRDGAWKKNLEKPAYILKALDGHPKVKSKVAKHWSQITRRISVDTGTSVDELCASALQHIKIPSPDTVLNHLEICTNSRNVFALLGRVHVHPRVIMVGGTQEYRTEAVCGHLAESFLDRIDLQFGISFVGATVIDVGTTGAEDFGRLGSDHYRISTIKSRMLELGMIRVVLADSTKITSQSLRAYYPYGALNPATIDIIVTDRDVGKRPGSKEEEENWRRLKDSGVAILPASHETLELAKGEIARRAERRNTITHE